MAVGGVCVWVGGCVGVGADVCVVMAVLLLDWQLGVGADADVWVEVGVFWLEWYMSVLLLGMVVRLVLWW